VGGSRGFTEDQQTAFAEHMTQRAEAYTGRQGLGFAGARGRGHAHAHEPSSMPGYRSPVADEPAQPAVGNESELLTGSSVHAP
jgi:hypothetical protein